MDKDEKLIKDALDSIRTPDFDINTAVQNRIEADKIQRVGGDNHLSPISFKRTAVQKAVATTAAALFLMIIGVVAIQTLSHINYLEPEEGIVSIASTEEPLIEPEPVIPTETILPHVSEASPDDGISEDANEENTNVVDGIRIEIISVEIHEDRDSRFDIYLRLQDLEGNRLDESTAVYFSAYGSQGAFRSIAEVIEYNPEDGSVIVHGQNTLFGGSHFLLDPDLERHEFSLTIRGIYYDFRHYQNVILPIDFSVIDHAPSTVYARPGSEFNAIWHISDNPNRFIWNELRDQIHNEGFTFLAPHQLDVDMGIETVDQIISSVGIVDGQLRMQTYEHRPEDPFGWQPLLWYSDPWFFIPSRTYFYLIDPDGDRYRDFIAIAFDVIGDHVIPTGDRGPNAYMERIFDVDISRLAEYQLSADFRTRRVIELDWHTTFEIETPAILWMDDLTVHFEDMDLVVTRVRLTPRTLEFTLVDSLGREIWINPMGDPEPVSDERRRVLEVDEELPDITEIEAVIIVTEEGEIQATPRRHGLTNRSIDMRSLTLSYDVHLPEGDLDLDTVIEIRIYRESATTILGNG